MIVLDLEWNRGYDKTPLDEILQIGAVRLTGLDQPIADTFSVFIRPRVHKRIASHTKVQLPELEQSLNSELDFPTAYAAFLRWCGEDRIFAQWGHDDLHVLEKNCVHWGIPPLVPEKNHDFQWAFSAMMAQDRQIRLCDAVEYLGFPTPFCFHNALHDAVYTALIGGWLGEKRALAEPPPKLPKPRRRRWVFCDTPFPPQPQWRVGPFPARKAALNARGSRKPLCPLCRGKGLVSTWYYTQPDVCYAPFRCPEHGAFLSRLTLSPLDDGTWVGQLAVPVLTAETLAAFEAAYAAERHLCRSAKKRKKRRWYPKRSTP